MAQTVRTHEPAHKNTVHSMTTDVSETLTKSQAGDAVGFHVSAV